MDQVTQQNAAMVEESTAASRNLAMETKSLSSLVEFFSVGTVRHDAADQPPAQPAPRPHKAPVAQARTPRSHGVAVARKPQPQAAADDWTEF